MQTDYNWSNIQLVHGLYKYIHGLYRIPIYFIKVTTLYAILTPGLLLFSIWSEYEE
jgi:hypothetical protein